MEYCFEIRQPFSSNIDSDGLWDSWKYRVVNSGQRCFYTNSDTTSPGHGNTALGPIIFKNILPGQDNKVTDDVRLASNGTPLDTVSFGVQGIGNYTPVASSYTTGAIVETDISGVVYLKYMLYDTLYYNGWDL